MATLIPTVSLVLAALSVANQPVSLLEVQAIKIREERNWFWGSQVDESKKEPTSTTAVKDEKKADDKKAEALISEKKKVTAASTKKSKKDDLADDADDSDDSEDQGGQQALINDLTKQLKSEDSEIASIDKEEADLQNKEKKLN